MTAWLTALLAAVAGAVVARRAGTRKAVAGLLGAAGSMLALAALVSLQLCSCSQPLRTDTLPDVRFALALAAGLGVAGIARLLLKSGA